MPRPTKAQVNARILENREADRQRQIESTRDHYDVVLGNVPETREMFKVVSEVTASQFEVQEHGHLSIGAREVHRQREILAELAAENRGEMRAPDPEPEWVPVVVEHPDAGTLRLLTDGNGWIVRLYGTDYGIGPVRKRERHKDGSFHPRPDVVAAAAARALNDPNGPMQPAGSPVFVGNGTDDPTVITPVPRQPDVAERFRARIQGRTA